MSEKKSLGLVDGDIPKGQACPFLDKCGFKTENCPTQEKPNLEHNYSCAAARLWATVAAE